MARAEVQPVQDLVRRMTPVSAPPEQQAAIQKLREFLGNVEHLHPRCQLVGPHGESIPIPASLFHVLAYVVEVMAQGDAITIVPVGKELTTQQAADLLNISRQYLVRLLDEGAIPYTRTGKHRRLRIEHVLAFKEQRDHDRMDALTRLTHLSEDLDGYDELK